MEFFQRMIKLNTDVIDFSSYRTREEVKEVRETRDPIMTFKEKILAANLVTPDELKVRYETNNSFCYNV